MVSGSDRWPVGLPWHIISEGKSDAAHGCALIIYPGLLGSNGVVPLLSMPRSYMAVRDT